MLEKYVQIKFKTWLIVAIVLSVAALTITQLVYADSNTAEAPRSKATIDTPLGADVFQLTSMSGEEEMSRLFQFHLEMISDDPAIDPKQIVGKSLTLTIDSPLGGKRHFQGYVSRLVRSGSQAHGMQTVYQADVVPWLWFLTRTADVRIFQEMSVPDILVQVFNEYVIADVEFRLDADYPVREYSAQYRETDFDFVSRLMEHEGIYYFFEHSEDGHTLVVGDSVAGYGQLPGRGASLS